MERSDAYCVAHQSQFIAERSVGERKTPKKQVKHSHFPASSIPKLRGGRRWKPYTFGCGLHMEIGSAAADR